MYCGVHATLLVFSSLYLPLSAAGRGCQEKSLFTEKVRSFVLSTSTEERAGIERRAEERRREDACIKMRSDGRVSRRGRGRRVVGRSNRAKERKSQPTAPALALRPSAFRRAAHGPSNAPEGRCAWCVSCVAHESGGRVLKVEMREQTRTTTARRRKSGGELRRTGNICGGMAATAISG